jgi:hypothetical protein
MRLSLATVGSDQEGVCGFANLIAATSAFFGNRHIPFERASLSRKAAGNERKRKALSTGTKGNGRI